MAVLLLSKDIVLGLVFFQRVLYLCPAVNTPVKIIVLFSSITVYCFHVNAVAVVKFDISIC